MKTPEQDNATGLSSDLVLALNARVTTDPNWGLGGGGDDSGRTGHVRAVSDETIALATLQPEERELLALADGHRSVEELIRLSGLPSEVALKRLRILRDRGILVPVGDGQATSSLAGGGDIAPAGAPGSAVQSRTDDQRDLSEGGGDGDALPDGASALTKAIDEYLELAAGAMATAAATEVDDAEPETRAAADPSAPVAGATGERGDPAGVTTLPGMIGGSGPVPVGGQANPGQVPHSGPMQQSTFRPNVTAFWIPAMLEGVANPAGPAGKDPAAPSAGGVPREVGSPGSSGATVVVTGSRGVGSGKVAATTQVASPASSHASGEGVSSQAKTEVGARSSPSSAQPLMSAPIPFRVGNYEVATRIAQGGMGSIYVCRRTGELGFQRLFTLKVVRQHSAKRDEAVQSFKREAHVGSLLSHPNLQTVLDVGSYKDQPFLVLDYVEGTSLSELLSEDRRAPVPVVIAILLDVLRGLHHAHQLVNEKGVRFGLVHGDVSPQNVLVGVDGTARLTDFGSATFTGEGRLHDPKWNATGKPAYMAPEQLRAEPLDARTDVFAVGVLMWTVLTGQKLFAGDSYDETIMKVLRKKIPPPSALGAPACFDEVCLKALSRSREGRYGSADEMARDLLRVASNENILASPADVGHWVRRESGEALNEQRRRIQLMFGSGKLPPGRVDTSGPSAPKSAAAAPPRVAPATIVLDSVQRQLHTPKLGRNRSLPSRTVSLPTLRRPQKKTFWSTWNVVIVSALLALPVTLTIGYFVSNLLIAQPRPAPPSAAPTADAATSQ